MKAFSSSILSTKQSDSVLMESAVGTFKSITDDRSDLVRLLEFNEAAAKAEYNEARDYYIGILRSIQNKSGSYSEAINACFNQYEAVKATAKLMLSPDSDAVTPCYSSEYDKWVQIKKQYPGSVVTQTYCTKEPASVESDTLLIPFVKYCKSVADGTVENKNIVEDICNWASKSAGIDSASNLEEFIDNYESFYEFDTREIACANMDQYNACPKSAFYVWGDKLFQYTDLAISYLKVNEDSFENPNAVREIVKNICDGISTYTIMAIKTRQINVQKCNELDAINVKNIAEGLKDATSLSESMKMYGDEIDGKSIFKDLDENDFNPTEFMDLGLVAEHMLKMDTMEAYKYGMTLEAKYLAEQNYEALNTIHEAIGQKIKEGFGKFIEALKKIAAKFVEAIMFNFGTEKAWLTKYKNIILNNEFKKETQVAVYCNLKNAVDHIKEVVPPLASYAELSQDTSAFASEEDFFDKKFKNAFPGIETAPNVPKDGTIAERCKYYLGAKWADGAKDDGTFEDFGKKWPTVAEMYQWLLDTEKLAKTTQAQIKNIERTVENYQRSAAKSAVPEGGNNQQGQQQNTQSNTNNTQQTSPQTTQNASAYYSYIFGKIMTEADIKPAPAADNNHQGGDQQQNNNQGNNKNYNKTTQGDTDEEVKKSNDPGSVISGRMQIYCNVCKQVLTAKMTAITYAHKEMLDIMRAIVKARMGDSADIQLKSQGEANKNDQQNNNQNQQQNAQANTVPVKKGKKK